MSIRRLMVMDLALLALMVLGSRTALVIHELGGHALPAWIFGARGFVIRLSTLGGGYVDWLGELHGWRAAVTSLGGIALNLVTGGIAWLASRRFACPGLLRAGLLVFGAGSVGGAVVYLADGFYYGSGDPLGFAPDGGDLSHVQWVWIFFLPLAFATAYAASGQLARAFGTPLTAERARSRIGWFLATAGLAGAAYGGMWMALRQPDKEGSTREWRIEREVAKETERRASAAPVPPTLPAIPLPAPAPPVRPDEVTDRVPSRWGPATLFAMFALGGLLGLGRRPPARGELPLSGVQSLGLALIAAGTAVACRLLG